MRYPASMRLCGFSSPAIDNARISNHTSNSLKKYSIQMIRIYIYAWPAALHIKIQSDMENYLQVISWHVHKLQNVATVYPKKYAHGFCFAVLCCGYTLTDFPISIRLTSLALWQSNDCPSASKATLMNMDKCFMWIHYERLHNHNKAKHNKTMCIFLEMYCMTIQWHRASMD